MSFEQNNQYNNQVNRIANNVSLQTNNVPLNNRYTPPKETLGSRVKTDLLINGAMGGVLGDSTIKLKGFKEHGFVDATKSGVSKFGRGFVGGIATSPQASIAMYAGDKATERLKKHYLENDDKASLLHAGMIAAPAAIGGTYGFGAMMHGSDNIGKVFSAKNKQQRVSAVKNLFNPMQHLKRGINETKDGFKAFNLKNKMGTGSRLMKGFNLLGLGLAAYQGYDYYKKKKAQEKAKANLNASNPYIQKTAGVPILSPLIEVLEHKSDLKKMENEYGKSLARASKEYKEVLNKKKQALEDAFYDVAGVGIVGTGGKIFYDKVKSWANTPSVNNQTQFTY